MKTTFYIASWTDARYITAGEFSCVIQKNENGSYEVPQQDEFWEHDLKIFELNSDKQAFDNVKNHLVDLIIRPEVEVIDILSEQDQEDGSLFILGVEDEQKRNAEQIRSHFGKDLPELYTRIETRALQLFKRYFEQ